MKRMRDSDAATSGIRSAIEELSGVALTYKSDSTASPVTDEDDDLRTAHLPLKPFLSVCSLLLQFLDKIGPTMAVLRQDIHQNIQRLEKFHDSDPSIYWDMGMIVSVEVKEEVAKKGHSCSKAFVWLTRSLDVALALLQSLVKNLDINMEQAVEECYAFTLKPWHGWISSTAYRIALKLLPTSHSLVSILKVDEEQDDDVLRKEMQVLVSLLVPFLEHNKRIMSMYGIDKLKAT